MADERLVTQDNMSSAFETGEVFQASDEELLSYLKLLCTGHIPNDMIRYRETNRCITINAILTKRFMDKVDRDNSRLQKLVFLLTIVGIIVAIVQIFA